jgi:hypothetical protein
MDWIDLARDRDRWRARVNAVMLGSFSSSCTISGFWRRAQLHEWDMQFRHLVTAKYGPQLIPLCKFPTAV